MNYKRLPFPKYLNRPRLFIIFETDELKFAVAVSIVVFLLTFFTNMPPYIILIFFVGSFYISIRIYKKTFKNVKNVMDHFFYNLGLYNPKKRKNEKIEIPYGFIKRFID